MAFERALPNVSNCQKAVLKHIVVPSTSSEIANRLGWSINRVTPRVLELRKMGIVEDNGVRCCRMTGFMAHEWVIR